MSDFSKEIQNFQRYGTYTYKFDNVGNMTFDSSSVNFNQVYVAFPLQNIVYDNSKINTLYNLEFEEFVPVVSEVSPINVDDIQQELDIVQEENVALRSRLEDIISASESNSSEVDQMASKQVILELRKVLGQGRIDSDFSEDFPYTPIIKAMT